MALHELPEGQHRPGSAEFLPAGALYPPQMLYRLTCDGDGGEAEQDAHRMHAAGGFKARTRWHTPSSALYKCPIIQVVRACEKPRAHPSALLRERPPDCGLTSRNRSN